MEGLQAPSQVSIFKPGAWGRKPCKPGFLKLLLVRTSVCVCLPLRALITSGVIWCAIGHVRLIKQVSQLFPAFNYFIWHLLSIKWMGMAILTQHVTNACQRKLRWHITSYKRITGKTECFIYKNDWENV